ncbi:hypothetical protein HQ576_15205, partial [bacterium]|nr:hypothetical protein [bacterium]
MAKYPLLGSLLVAILSTGLAAEQVAPVAADVAARGNLLANPGFEQGGALPARWARYPKKDERGNRHARDLTIAHDGKASGLLSSVAPHVPGKAGIQWNQYGLEVEGGSTLIACFWTRSEGGPVGTGGVHVYDKAGQHLGFTRILATSPGGHWAFAHQHIPLPPEAAKIGFAAYGNDRGKVWFDNCAIIGTPNAAAARATPTIDGHLDEPCWSDARAIRTFAVHPGTRLRSDGTRAWLAYDDDALYVAFRCPHPKDATLRAKATRPDGDTWLDDSIEVFLDPQHSHRDYFQFCVNCRGIVRDSHRTDTGWQSGARAVAVREADEWTVELAIPYDSLRITLDTGPTWGINLVRNDRVRGEVLTWSLDGLHKPGRFGNVTLRPRLRRFWLADWKRRAAEMRARERQFRGELEATGLPKATFAKARTQLDAIGALLDRTPTANPDGQEQAEPLRTAIAEAERRLREARGAALAAVYALDGHGGDSFRVVIAHSMQKVRRDGPVLDGVLARDVKLEAARDEAESFQLVVIPNDTPLKQVTVHAPPLRGPGGALPLTWHRVGYVQTATPSYAAEFVGWWPDPLLPAAPFDVAKGQRQPLWFTVNVP